jgi:DNA-binding response OmpR family regulator
MWGYADDPLTSVIDAYIRRFRGKIDDGHTAPLIKKTLRDIGYKLDLSRG